MEIVYSFGCYGNLVKLIYIYIKVIPHLVFICFK